MAEQRVAEAEDKLVSFPGAEGDQAASAGRRRRRRNAILLALVMVALPTFAAGLYYGIFATDRYVSRAELTIKSSANPSSEQLGSVLGGMIGQGGNSDAYAVQEYIQSEQIVGKLQDWLDLRARWQAQEIDWLARLEADASRQDLHDYYLSMVDATYDSEKSVIHLTVQGYAPADANALATSIIELSDQLVNEMSGKLRKDTLKFARTEVDRAEDRLREARLAVKKFQNANRNLDPSESASALSGIIAQIRSKLSEVRTEISAKSSYLRPDSAAMKSLKAEERALEQQLARERESLMGSGDDAQDATAAKEAGYPSLLAQYEELKIEEEFARDAYKAARTELENARVEASRKQMYLVPFVEPTTPDEPTKPDRERNVAVVLIASIVACGIVSLLIAAVREHARF